MSKSFISYYNAFMQNGTSHRKVSTIVMDAANEIPVALPKLHSGEKIIAQAQGVHVFQPLSSNNQGLIGTLFITNFRLIFETIAFPEDRREHQFAVRDLWHPWTPGLIDIPLASISSVQRISKRGRKKPFKIGPLKRILITCKTFRMETFSFLQSSPNESQGVAVALYGYVFTPDSSNLFVKHHKDSSVGTRDGDPLKFGCRKDWDEELFRALGGETRYWRITQGNEHFDLCPSLPKCFVVPASFENDHALDNICSQLSAADERRPLVWCWSLPNGISLSRMSADISDEFFKAVQRSHPDKAPPCVLDIGSLCPSTTELRKSHDSWRDSFLLDSTDALESSDDKWSSELESSRWIFNIWTCLETTKSVLDTMQLRGQSVILQETGDRDFNCVISALTQLCFESARRTVIGFRLLIEKEFVAFGHRFQDRLGLVHRNPEAESPVFLVFLECVYQLMTAYPTAFEFTDGFLILLWDSAVMGAFSSLSFNSHHDQLQLVNGIRTTGPDLGSVDLTSSGRFYNPLYFSTFLLEKLQAAFPFFKMERLPSDVIVPSTPLHEISIWRNLYFRFIPPLTAAKDPKPGVVRRLGHEIEALWKEIDDLSIAMGRTSHLHANSNSMMEELVDGDEAGAISRRRAQLVRPFSTANGSQSLITFQK